MVQQSFNIKFKVNEGLIFSPSNLLEHFLYGIKVEAKDGSVLGTDVIEQKIKSAQNKIENDLMIKLFRQVFEENTDFDRENYKNWSFMKMLYPVREPLQISGYLGKTQQIVYPLSWASQISRTDERLYERTLHLVPAGSNATVQNTSVVFSGITPHLGFYGYQTIPNYWTVKYCTGFKIVPDNIIEAIGKLAAIPILGILGDVVFGAGLSSMSLSIDGLSQSLGTTAGGGNSIFSARIKQYTEELKIELAELRAYYKGLTFVVL